MKKIGKLLSVVIAGILLTGLAACSNNNIIGGVDSSDKVIILTSAMVGTPTDANDPYRKYIKDHYGLDVELVATSDFATEAQLKFSNYDEMPDIVSFTSVDAFRSIFNQGTLLSDWTPYLKDMPNFSKIVNTADADRPGQPSVARIMMTEEDRLTGLWTLPDPPNWSLKIREDWADEYRATTQGGTSRDGLSTYPAGNLASTDPATGRQVPWQPYTPDDLLNFARWIKANKNGNQSSLDCYGFSTAGERTDFGVLGTWVPLMYGAVSQLPWGVYFDENGNVDFGITDGTHKMMLDFIATLIREKLIEPNWYYNDASQKTSFAGKIGIEWYPGEISENTQSYFNRNNITDPATGKIVDTTDWWHTYPVPKAPGCENGGFQPSDGFLGQIITVSAKASNDREKMSKIIAFLDDLAMTKDVNADGSVTYNRSAAYNALRWGVGIEEGLAFQKIEGTDQVYLYTGDENADYYRTRLPGAWDWGAFFRSTDDGVVQGSSSATVTRITERVVEQDTLTASYVRRLQYGSVLKLAPSTVSSLTNNLRAFEYTYVYANYADAQAAQQAYDSFRDNWMRIGGNDVFTEAKRQFQKLGFID